MCLTLDWFWEQEGIKVQKIDLGGSTLPSSEIWGTAKKRYYERLSTQIRQYTLCTTQSGKQMPRKWTSWSKTFTESCALVTQSRKWQGKTLQNWEEMNFL